VATTEKVAEPGMVTVAGAGCVVMLGGVVAAFTVSVATALVTLPEPFDTTQSNVAPLSVIVVVPRLYEDVVAPGMAAPPRRHW
jgi:hypothetical protein